MIQELIRTFRKPTPQQMIEEELLDAQRELLKAQTYAEYYHSMSKYNETRIARLTKLKEGTS
jgi:hypothetical protein